MSIRAAICDIYKTILEVGPPPSDADQRWQTLCRQAAPGKTGPTLGQFAEAATEIIRRQHAGAKAIGVPYPEIYWPDVAGEALPWLNSLGAAALGDFLFEHAQLQRTVRLMPGAAEALAGLAGGGVRLGLVSNSQPYTLRELDSALQAAALTRQMFLPELCFLSFDNGFSKPDAHVFRILAARLAQMGISPGEAIIIGDREDNDIVPARAAGFRTWRLSGESTPMTGGGWSEFSEALRESKSSAGL